MSLIVSGGMSIDALFLYNSHHRVTAQDQSVVDELEGLSLIYGQKLNIIGIGPRPQPLRITNTEGKIYITMDQGLYVSRE